MPDNPNDLPDIPSFKSSQQEKEKKASGLPLPSLSRLKLRGGDGAASVMERLKSLKKKDLIFIASGLSVLLTAPLAEHFMLGPKQQETLRRGFDLKGAPFTEVSPYEAGAGGIAPGGLPGQPSEVITPLNVRDPSALVMGPGAAQQPPTPAGGAGAGGAAGGEDYRNALKEAAKAGAARAAESAGLPAARGALAGALRGLGATAGGSGASFTLPPISAAGVPNRPAGGGNFVRSATIPGYGGVAGRSLDEGAGGAAAALRRAGDDASKLFNAPGSAAGNLTNAAQTAIPTGGLGGGPGGPSTGAGFQNPSGNSTKEVKTLGESLAFLRAKMLQEKQIELMFKKKSWLEFERYKLMQEEIIKGVIQNILGEGLFKPMGKKLSDLMDSITGGTQAYFCYQVQAGSIPGLPNNQIIPADAWNSVGFSKVGQKDSQLPGTDYGLVRQWKTAKDNKQAVCRKYPDDEEVGPDKDKKGGGPGANPGQGGMTPVGGKLTDDKAALDAQIKDCGTDQKCIDAAKAAKAGTEHVEGVNQELGQVKQAFDMVKNNLIRALDSAQKETKAAAGNVDSKQYDGAKATLTNVVQKTLDGSGNDTQGVVKSLASLQEKIKKALEDTQAASQDVDKGKTQVDKIPRTAPSTPHAVADTQAQATILSGKINEAQSRLNELKSNQEKLFGSQAQTGASDGSIKGQLSQALDKLTAVIDRIKKDPNDKTAAQDAQEVRKILADQDPKFTEIKTAVDKINFDLNSR